MVKGFTHPVLIIIVSLLAFFLLGPFLFKAITGDYPPGFPKEGFSKLIPPPEAFRKAPVEKTYQLGQPIPGPIAKPKVFKSLILFELDDTQSVIRAKELGANAVTIMVDIGVQGNKFSLPSDWRGKPFNLEQIIGPFINEAHRQGLYVELRTSQSPYAKPDETADDKQLEDSLAKVIGEFANLANKYQIYQLSLTIEADTLVGFAYKHPPSGAEFAKKINHFVNIARTAARQNYQGRLGIGLAVPEQHVAGGNLSKIDFKGFDYFAFTHYPHPQRDGSVDNYLENSMVQGIKATRRIANLYNISEILWAETGVINPVDKAEVLGPKPFFIKTDEQQEADFYKTLFAKSQGMVDGYSFFYEFPIFSIKNQQAEQVVKEWFNK